MDSSLEVIEMPEPEFKNGVWVCPLCGFKAMSKKVVATHMEREHPEAFQNEEKEAKNPGDKKQKNGKKKKERRPWYSREFEPLIGKEVTVVLKNGVFIVGTLKEETQYNLVLINAEVRGKKYKFTTEYILANKGNLSHVHPRPENLEVIEEEGGD